MSRLSRDVGADWERDVRAAAAAASWMMLQKNHPPLRHTETGAVKAAGFGWLDYTARMADGDGRCVVADFDAKSQAADHGPSWVLGPRLLHADGTRAKSPHEGHQRGALRAAARHGSRAFILVRQEEKLAPMVPHRIYAVPATSSEEVFPFGRCSSVRWAELERWALPVGVPWPALLLLPSWAAYVADGAAVLPQTRAEYLNLTAPLVRAHIQR
jgi:hypothetical protein